MPTDGEDYFVTPERAQAVFNPYNCGICGELLQFGRGCQGCTLKIQNLPDPLEMSASDRWAEVHSYRPYPVGVIIEVIKTWLERLVGWVFTTKNGRRLPQWNCVWSWRWLAEQAATLPTRTS